MLSLFKLRPVLLDLRWELSGAAYRASRFACNSRLDGPVPPTVVVSYGEGGVDHFLNLADQIEENFPQLLIEGEEDPSLKGQLAVSLHGSSPIWKGPFPVQDATGALDLLDKELNSSTM